MHKIYDNLVVFFIYKGKCGTSFHLYFPKLYLLKAMDHIEIVGFNNVWEYYHTVFTSMAKIIYILSKLSTFLTVLGSFKTTVFLLTTSSYFQISFVKQHSKLKNTILIQFTHMLRPTSRGL